MTSEPEAGGVDTTPSLKVRLGGSCVITVRMLDGTAHEYNCTLTPTELPDGNSN